MARRRNVLAADALASIVSPSLGRSARKTSGLLVALICTALIGMALFAATPAAAQTNQFIRGDVNEDGALSIADLMMIVQYIIIGTHAPHCQDTADLNDDGHLDITDPVNLISFLFGPTAPLPMPAPYPNPGVDPTDDELGCVGPLDNVPVGVELPHVFFLMSISNEENQGFAVAPGDDLVSIPIQLSAESDFGIEGLALSFSFDPTIVAEAQIDFSEGVPNDFSADLYMSHANGPGRVYGYVVMEMLSPVDSLSFPVGEKQLLGHLNLRVHEDVPVGTTFDIQFSTLPPLAGAPAIRNEIVKEGGAAILYPFTYPMTVPVRPQSEIFIRGDITRDGVVNNLDGFQLISFLYSGFSSSPLCLDAADVNDNGAIDLADVIVLLQTVFVADAPLKPSSPFPYQGVDESEDSLDCE